MCSALVSGVDSSKNMQRKPRLVILLASMVIAGVAEADIVNGDFEDGLNGWSVESGEFAAVTDAAGNHWAMSQTGGRLRQGFDLPLGAQALTFRYFYHQTGSGGGSGPQDFLNFYLQDPDTLANLIPPPEGFEGFPLFLGQDHLGLYAFNPEYVSVTEPDDEWVRFVTVDLAHLPPQQSARLEFGSFEFDDGRDSRLAIDDVVVVVPEPASIMVLTFGALFVARSHRRRFLGHKLR